MDIHRQETHRRGCEPFSWIDVNLKRIQSNYQRWQAFVQPAVCAAVLKANAYGLGAAPVGQALFEAGCRHFFVAYLDEAALFVEGLREKGAFPSSTPDEHHYCLYILDGPFVRNWYEEVNYLGCIPVLNTLANISEWNQFAQNKNQRRPAVLHFDTGLHRLGLPMNEYPTFWQKYLEKAYAAIDWVLWMSHPVASSTPEHEANAIQLERVMKIRETVPEIPFSYADTGGVLLGRQTHFNLVRVGIGLYGLDNPLEGIQNCLTVGSLILQIQDVPAHQGIGYDWTYTTDSPRRIATIACGYSDGIARDRGPTPLYFRLRGKKVPVVGQISMDLCTIDVTDVPEAQVGDSVEIIGDQAPIAEFSAASGIISHRLLTGFGDRPWRFFSGLERS